MELYPSELELRIDWSELDLFGHVNNVMFMKYIQAARVRFWEMAGIDNLYVEQKKGPMLLSTQCRYLLPLYYPGNIRIRTRVSFIKNTSFGFDHQVWNHEGKLAAEAQDVMVWYDFNLAQKEPLPDSARLSFGKLQPGIPGD